MQYKQKLITKGEKKLYYGYNMNQHHQAKRVISAICDSFNLEYYTLNTCMWNFKFINNFLSKAELIKYELIEIKSTITNQTIASLDWWGVDL